MRLQWIIATALSLSVFTGCSLTRSPIDLPDPQLLVEVESAGEVAYFAQRWGDSPDGQEPDRSEALIIYGPETGGSYTLDATEVPGGALRPPFRLYQGVLHAVQGNDLVALEQVDGSYQPRVVLTDVEGIIGLDLHAGQALLEWEDGVRLRDLYSDWDSGQWVHRGRHALARFDRELPIAWVVDPTGAVTGHWLNLPTEVPAVDRTMVATFDAPCSVGSHYRLAQGDEFLLVYHRGAPCGELMVVDRNQLLFLARDGLIPEELPNPARLPAASVAHMVPALQTPAAEVYSEGRQLQGKGRLTDVKALGQDHFLLSVLEGDHSRILELDLRQEVVRERAALDEPVHSIAVRQNGHLVLGSQSKIVEVDADGQIVGIATTDPFYGFEAGTVKATNAFLNGAKYVGIGLGYTVVAVTVVGLFGLYFWAILD